MTDDMPKRTGWTDGKPFVVTEAQCKLNWLGGKNGAYFRCCLCGHKFKAGDTARWQFTNATPGAGGNPMICQKCDGSEDEVIAKWKQMHDDIRNKFWWFVRGDEQ